MNKKQLEEKFDKALDDFSSEVNLNYSQYSKESVNGGDIAELARQTYYALNEFKKAILEYLG